LFYMDFYFGEFVILSSLVCYIIVLIRLVSKRGKSLRTVKVELPALLHFGTIFALTAVVLLFWHHPFGSGDLYGHIFNLFVLLRFAPSPILALFTNPTVKVELPALLHFGTIFALTAVVLLFWHHPVGSGDLYGHVFNLFVLLRFAPSPILALFTNP
uniref:Cytochrome-c oxidase n=1 Tax=Heligmosomoides polygyrus TaxID=6339 RepID=A0A183GQ41_HELPZ